MPTWVTRAQAAEILGLSIHTVSHYIQDGLLDSRAQAGPGNGGLMLHQVEELAERRDQARKDREQRAAQLKPDLRPQPPDADHEWLTTGQVARELGVTRDAVKQRCYRGTLLHQWHDGRRWIRRDLLRKGAGQTG